MGNTFPEGPIDDNPEDVKKRHFTKWIQVANTDKTHYYQGHLDESDIKDGRGIAIIPGEWLTIGHFRHG